MTNSSSDDDKVSRGAQAVRALLERHGVPKHRHSAFVGEFFDLSRAAAHQRVSKSTAWTLEELHALAEHFGETLGHVVAPAPSRADDGPVDSAKGVDATLCVGASNAACRIWLAPEGKPSPDDLFVALPMGGSYVVMPAQSAPPAHALRITRMAIDQSVRPAAKRVAVFDTNPRSAKALCEQLARAGLDACPFSASTELLAAAAQAAFDGYVLDWSSASGQDPALLAALRRHKAPCALVLLGSRMTGASQDLADLADAVAKHRAQFLEKPVQLPLLVSALQSGF
jgi:CheY-like chemotaxis protein